MAGPDPRRGRRPHRPPRPGPWNLVVNDTQWAFIDWDVAAPGSRLWDLAYALHGFVPLSADPRWQRHDAGHRLRVFVDAYGLDESQRGDLILLLARRTRAMHDFPAKQAATGTQPWTRLWHTGRGDAWRADADYIQQHTAWWSRARSNSQHSQPSNRGSPS